MRILQSACWIITISIVLFLSINTRADGGFVVPKFVWDKHRDINEPTQKAIIAFDAGHEDLLLQVKYDGPVEEFGWLIPVPNLPTVKLASMDCFYELSKYTQKKFDYEPRTRGFSAKVHGEASAEAEPPVKVIDVKTVGEYRVAILSSRDAGALESWLNANSFAIPPDKADVIDSYVKRGWYFVAIKINLSKATGFEVVSGPPRAGVDTKAGVAEKLSQGELHPLRLSFASDRCVFPLRISSLNGQPSEVQVYVLSKEPLVEERLFEENMAENYRWRSNMVATLEASRARMAARRASLAGRGGLPVRPEVPRELANRSWIDDNKLVPYAQVSRSALPVCSREMALLREGEPWLMKLTRTFKPEEMQDLKFVPAIPVFVTALKDGEGAFAAANLAWLGRPGGLALLMALESGNSSVRAHALAAMESETLVPRDREVTSRLEKRLPALLKDTDPEVRFHALNAAAQIEDHRFVDQALELLRDDNPEVCAAAESYLRINREEMSKRIPLLHEMLKDTNSTVQMCGLRLLMGSGVTPSREELLPLFSIPRLEVAAVALSLAERGGAISCSEARPLLQNSLPMVRLIAINVLYQNMNSESVDLALPLLKDQEEFVRIRARDMLADMTGRDFSTQPEPWEKWWAENKSSAVFNREQAEQRRMQRFREGRAGLRPMPDPSLPEQPQKQ